MNKTNKSIIFFIYSDTEISEILGEDKNVEELTLEDCRKIAMEDGGEFYNDLESFAYAFNNEQISDLGWIKHLPSQEKTSDDVVFLVEIDQDIKNSEPSHTVTPFMSYKKAMEYFAELKKEAKRLMLSVTDEESIETEADYEGRYMLQENDFENWVEVTVTTEKAE